MAWTTLTMKIMTPVFNAGANDHAELRVTSLRGALRYWLRALVGRSVGPDLDRLAALEAQVFGATDHASPVKLRIPDPPSPEHARRPPWLNRDVCYLLGQSLSDMKAVQLNRDHIPTGTFRLQARFDDQPAAALALASLWLLCTYGGIGARTRRGFGSLCVVGVDGPLPDGWTETRLRQPGIDFYRRLTALQPPPGVASPDPTSHDQQDRDCLLHGLGTDGWDTATPTYPVLGTEHTKAGLGVRTYPTWHALLTDTGRQLREYRADDVLHNGRSRTREWTEVIQHKTHNHFGLGGLGLPVVFDKKTEVHADNAAGEKLRRASPLWLHPVHDGTEWRLLSFALINEFLPADVSVHLWLDGKQDRRLHVTAADADELATAWIEYQTRPPHAGR